MQHNQIQVSPIEKIISILSYITMGIVGIIWFIVAYAKKKRLRYFLMYNIAQSMVISIFLALIKLGLEIVLAIIAKIPFLDFIAAIIYYVFSYKILRIYSLNLSFTLPELIVFLFVGYIIAGILIGKILHIPFLTKIMNKTMQNYN